MKDNEPKIRIKDREELIYMLAETAAIELNVTCCYNSHYQRYLDMPDILYKMLAKNPENRVWITNPKTSQVRDRPLEINLQIKGPLQLSDNFEACAGTSRNIDRVQTVRFCRRDGSKTKSFCDNTHLKTRFKST